MLRAAPSPCPGQTQLVGEVLAPILVQVYKLQRYNALVSLGGWWELPPHTPHLQKHKMGSGCLQSWVEEEVSGSLGGGVKAKIKKPKV